MKDHADDSGSSPSGNELIMAAFCNAFTPPLKYHRTEKINNIRFPDAWTTSYWDGMRNIGMTVVVYEAQIHAFIEAAGKGSIAAEAGRVMAKALDLFSESDKS